MRHILKLLLITLLLGTTLFADEFKKPPYDKRLDLKVDGKLWYENADTNYQFAYNLGVYYQQNIKDNKTAEFWYKKSWDIKHFKDTAFNLGQIYRKDNNIQLSIEWYKKAIKKESLSAMKNLSLVYYDQKDYVKAVEYMLPLSGKKYTKKKVFDLFRTHWKFNEKIIKQGYEAQLKSKIIPEKLKYKGGI